jgi:hypothetical protein
MKDEVRMPGPDEYAQLREGIESIKRRLARLTVSVSLMTLVLILTVSAVFGNLVNYFSGDVLMWGGATAGAAVLGFALGWFSRRKP